MPASVVRLEWHSEARAQDFGLTSHSWLVVFLSGGETFKLEFLADQGVSKTTLSAADSSDSVRLKSLYDCRVAFEFAEPLSEETLMTIGRASAAKRYSIVQHNCHHWSLAIWNNVVPAALRQHTYPDQWKIEAVTALGLSQLFDARRGGSLLAACDHALPEIA
jgi:hypothetical protein